MDTKDNSSVPAAGISRREFVTAGAAVAAALTAPTILGATSKSGTQLPIMGEGEYVFEVQHDWGQDNLPAGLRYGNTHNVVVDQHGYVYIHHTVHPDSTIGDTVVVFDPKGRFVRSFGQMFRNSAHGMHIQKEGNTEYLYFADERHGLVTKRTLKGEEIWTMGYPQEAPTYQKGPGAKGPGGTAGLNFRPTNIAVDPNTLDFWFGDGYGSYYMFHFSQKTSTSFPKLVRTFGGPPPKPAAPPAAPGAPAAAGAAPAAAPAAPAPRAPVGIEFTNNPHGNWIDTRDPKNPVLLIADRGNRRVLRYTLDDKPIDVIEGTGLPCHFNQHKELIVVPDLDGRVHLIKDNKVVSSFGGDKPGTPSPDRTTQNRSDFVAGQFCKPHGAAFDHDGNLFITEWVEIGRVNKLRRV
jgi:hypothetical protein